MRKVDCPVCSFKSLSELGREEKLYVCRNCGSRLTVEDLVKYAVPDIVTKEMRTDYFQNTGMYSSDVEIYDWWSNEYE